MPSIYVTNTGKKIETDPVTSILVALQLHRVPIETICGGRARCGRCVIRIVEGAGFLSKKRPAEMERLKAVNAAQDMRLACQTHSWGDVTIEIINLKQR